MRMRTADRRTQEHPLRGTTRAGALPWLVRRAASRASSARRGHFDPGPTRRRGCGPAAGPATSGSRGPGSRVDTSPRPKMAGAGDLARLPFRAGLSTFPQPRSSTAVYRLTSVLLRSPAGLSTGRYPGRPRAGVIGASSHASPGPPRAYRRSPEVPGALVTVRPPRSHMITSGGPDRAGTAPGDCHKRRCKAGACRQPGRHRFSRSPGGVTAPRPIAPKPPAASPR